nr:TetR/AcrR family transcriptional regulator [Mammaliicoccus sp. Marseille-Q6498]
MNKSTDLRVIKTKKALSESLLDLLANKAFSVVTVNEICEHSLVHRTTFYKHYMDKFDLLQYALQENTKEFFNIDIHERLEKPFQSMEKSFITKLSDVFDKQTETNDSNFGDVVINHFITLFSKDFENNINKVTVRDKFPQSLLTYIYGANLAAIVQWAKSEMKDINFSDLDEIFNQINIIGIEDNKK